MQQFACVMHEPRVALRRLATIALALLTVACRAGTAVTVSVDAFGLSVPDQIAALHLRVTNPELPDGPPTFDSQTLTLCGSAAQAGCYALPLSVVLRPGEAAPSTAVRVEVIALDSSGAEVVHDAAVFRFSDGAQQRLDFHLSPPCLRTYCAAQDRICGPNGGCVAPDLPSAAGAASGDAGASPSGTIEKWYQSSGGVFGNTTLVLPKPFNARPGDVLVALIPTGPNRPDFTIVARGSTATLTWHRIADSDPDTGYEFPGTFFTTQFAQVGYRGVTRVIPGAAFDLPDNNRYVMPSLDVPVAGSWLTTWIGHKYATVCTSNDQPGTYATAREQLFEAPDLKIGPTGVRAFDCQDVPGGDSFYFAAQALLVP